VLAGSLAAAVLVGLGVWAATGLRGARGPLGTPPAPKRGLTYLVPPTVYQGPLAMRTRQSGLHIVFVGDSITRAAYLDPSLAKRFGGGGMRTGYAWRLAAELPQRYPRVAWGTFTNVAQDGSAATQWVNWVDERVRPLQPDVVVVMLGINDCSRAHFYGADTQAQFEPAFRSLLAQLAGLTTRTGGHPRLLVATPPLTNPQHGEVFGARPDYMQPYLETIRTTARQRGIPVVDVWADWVARQAGEGASFAGNYVPTDGVHPSPAGQALIYQLMAPALRDVAAQ
jgi:lysophospholipase L1-like esterase